MADRLSDPLVQVLRERAQDPARRTEMGALTAGSASVDDVLRDLGPDPSQSEEHRAAVDDYLSGMNTPFAGMISNLATGDGSQARGLFATLGKLTGGKQVFAMMGDAGVVGLGPSSEPRPAPPPAREQDVAAAETALGFPLPPAVRQFYLEVADGGVGPGDGLFDLAELVAKHREMTHEPVGPQGQSWPARLLPIHGEDWDLVAIDRESGRLVFWDLEDLDDDDELPPDQPTWAASFVPEADSLEAWLGDWAARG
jgi:SMI1 / KNR4 family (SUKH-1)